MTAQQLAAQLRERQKFFLQSARCGLSPTQRRVARRHLPEVPDEEIIISYLTCPDCSGLEVPLAIAIELASGADTPTE